MVYEERCPFCRKAKEGAELLGSNEGAVAFYDAYPSAAGHILVVPRRHVARVAELEEAEYDLLFGLVREVVDDVEGEACNIGVNDGSAAGQTIGHVHVHVIPRNEDDGGVGKGGIRWVLPQTAPYWETAPS